MNEKEFKTLKDFEFDENGYFINDGYSDKYRLRQEAIKMLKNGCIYCSGFALRIGEDNGECKNYISEVDDFIRWFFDITDEDLK